MAIVGSLFIVSSIYYLFGIKLFDYSLLIPLLILFLTGLFDDIYQLDFKLKFIFQIIAAKIIIDNGLLIDNLHGVLGIYELNRIIAQLITIFFIVAIINAINFIDGIDGLAISISFLFFLFFEYFISTVSPYINLTLLIIAFLIPGYFFNFRKKDKVFLGDSGSLFLGGLISIYTLTVLSSEYIIKSEHDIHKIIFVFSILSYPIIDIVRIFFKRIFNKKSPFVADNNHLHHLLFDVLKSHLKTTISITAISFILLIIIQLIF